MYSPDTYLSSRYTLQDLTLTSRALSSPNLPTQKWQFDNLVLLADMLQELEYEIGPFTVISGFRTQELQRALASSGEPTGTGSMSFHEAGRAIDLFPTTMSIAEFFGQILARPNLRKKFSEIAIKPAQNALHLAINVPGDVREPKITGLSDKNIYERLSLEEIEKYAAPYLQAAQEFFDDSLAFASENKKALLLLSLGFTGLLFIMLKARK